MSTERTTLLSLKLESPKGDERSGRPLLFLQQSSSSAERGRRGSGDDDDDDDGGGEVLRFSSGQLSRRGTFQQWKYNEGFLFIREETLHTPTTVAVQEVLVGAGGEGVFEEVRRRSRSCDGEGVVSDFGRLHENTLALSLKRL